MRGRVGEFDLFSSLRQGRSSGNRDAADMIVITALNDGASLLLNPQNED